MIYSNMFINQYMWMSLSHWFWSFYWIELDLNMILSNRSNTLKEWRIIIFITNGIHLIPISRERIDSLLSNRNVIMCRYYQMEFNSFQSYEWISDGNIMTYCTRMKKYPICPENQPFLCDELLGDLFLLNNRSTIIEQID